MSIKVGDKVPSVKIKHLTAEGMQEMDTGELFAGKKVIMLGVPGAFTPSCSNIHLPGYVSKADELKAKGVDAIVCMAVNDPFVMKVWAEQQNVAGKVTMVPDGNGAFTKALGLDLDGSGAGLGHRCKRFSLVAEDGVVKSLEVENVPSEVGVTGVESCMVKL